MALNLFEVQPGAMLRLKSGATIEVVSNPGDGVWVIGRYLAGQDQATEGDEEMVCITDIAARAD
ncbi:MAG TPA: hypothetical protein VK457_15150 [Chloroflexota bacterium]|nr:hypothetical protein [Chloroflexota bacterium]